MAPRKKALTFNPMRVVDSELARRSMAEGPLCKSLGLQENAISKLRRRDPPEAMSVATLMKLANGLGLHPSAFFDGAPEAPAEEPIDLARRLVRALDKQ